MTLIAAWDVGDRWIVGADSASSDGDSIVLTKNKLWRPREDVVIGVSGDAPLPTLFAHAADPMEGEADEGWIYECFIRPISCLEGVAIKDDASFEALVVTPKALYTVSYPWDICENCGGNVVAIGSGRDAFLGAFHKWDHHARLFGDDFGSRHGIMAGLFTIAQQVCVPTVSAPFHFEEVLHG